MQGAIGPLADALAAGWPLGVAMAATVAGERLAASRRRAALNRALHELRRPLQALALSGPRGERGTLNMALAAADDLDCEINRSGSVSAPRAVDCRQLVEQVVERWRDASAPGRPALELRWAAARPRVIADQRQVAQALDNLIDNAHRHGTPPVCVQGTVARGAVRIAVADAGGGPKRRPRRGDPRHGHGLAVVRRVAREHGGRFALGRSTAGTVAVLELPLA